jgi:hypothetical protein
MNARRQAKLETLTPLPLIGRDEMNLADFPMHALTDHVPDGQKTLYFHSPQGKLTVTGSDAYGLPRSTEADVVVALIHLTKLKTDFRDIKVNFSRYEIIKLLGWPDEGWSYKRLDEALNCLAGVLLVYDKCWWNNRLKTYTSAKMHIIGNVEIIDNDARRKATQGGQRGLPLSSFEWDSKFIESCQADNLRKLNLDEYFSLRSAAAKRLYRFLGKRFYLQAALTFDLKEIAFDRVGLSRNYADAYKIKEKLQPAIEELEAIGFLAPLPLNERYTRINRGKWEIQFKKHTALPYAPPTAPLPAIETESPLVAELTARGISPDAARTLAREVDADTIRQQIDILDYRLSGKRAASIDDPAGWLVSAIRKPHAPPKGFRSAAQRQADAEAKQAKEREKAEQRRREKAEAEREKVEMQAILAYWKALTPSQQAELQAAADAQAEPEALALETGSLKSMGQTLRRNEHIRELLKNRQPVEA